MSLPSELVHLVVDFLDSQSAANFRLCSRRMNQIAAPRIWNNLVIICGLQSQEEYYHANVVNKKCFSKSGTLVIDINNVVKFTNEVVRYMPGIMNQFKTLSLVQFQTVKKIDLFGLDRETRDAPKRSLAWLAQNLHFYTNFVNVKMYCEPIDSAIVRQFRRNFPEMKMKYTILPFREYYDDMPVAHSIYVNWSAETAWPLTANYVSDRLTKVIFSQDDGVTSAPYDVKLLKETFAGCANLAKLILEVHLVDRHETIDWIPHSVREVHILGKYESRSRFEAGHVEKLKLCDMSKDSAMKITYNENTYVDCI